MPRIVAIMNQKGGVGKTTTTLNLGAALSTHGKRVLLVDLDPQANLTLGVGAYVDDLTQSVYELLTNPQVDSPKLVLKTQWENLDVIPSHIDLSGADIEMVTMIGRETRLSKALAPLHKSYDYILIDCLPSLSLLTVNAMAAVSEIFVPLQAHPFALKGLGKLFEVSGMIREAMNPALRVSGVLLTMFDGRTNVAKSTLDVLRADERLRDHMFTTTVKQNIKVAESQKEGIPVVFYDPSCHAAKAYHALALEVLEMESGVLASDCAERITERELAAGSEITFTPDLVVPPPPAKPVDSVDPGDFNPGPKSTVIPAEPQTHVAPVNALVNGPTGPADPVAADKPVETAPPIQPAQTSQPGPAEPKSPPPTQLEARPLHTPLPKNSPDVETIHPSNPKSESA